jgi:hypothetical protein
LESQERETQIEEGTLNGVVDGEDVDALAVLDVRALMDRNDVSKADTQVAADNLGRGIRTRARRGREGQRQSKDSDNKK